MTDKFKVNDKRLTVCPWRTSSLMFIYVFLFVGSLFVVVVLLSKTLLLKCVNFEPFECSAAANTGGENQNTDLLTYLWNPSFQQKTPTSTLYLWIVSTRPRNRLDSAWLSWPRDCRTGRIVGWTLLSQATQRFCYVMHDGTTVFHLSLVKVDSSMARTGLLSDRTLVDLCSRIALTFFNQCFKFVALFSSLHK